VYVITILRHFGTELDPTCAPIRSIIGPFTEEKEAKSWMKDHGYNKRPRNHDCIISCYARDNTHNNFMYRNTAATILRVTSPDSF